MNNYSAIYIPNPDCSFTKSGFQSAQEAYDYIRKPQVGGVPLWTEHWLITDTESLIKRLREN